MAIYRGTGGSIVGVDQADEFIVSVGQGGTGADNVTDARTNLGLGSAATKDETYFATAAQGALADTSVQTSDIGVIVLAPNGSAADLTDFPTFNQNTTGTADNVTGVVAIANGGTGQTTAVSARAALLPSYATNGGKILAVKADESDVEYIEVSGTGTVTSVGMSVPTGLSVSGSPVTTSGTLAVTYSAGYAIPTTAKQTEWDTAYTDRNKWDGGSTGLDAATGRTSLGLGTAATTAATDYATAAQGNKADSALQSSAIGVSIQGYDVDTTKNDVANTFTANQVIAVTDNTNAALRITQLGTGNALLVEDSSNPDSTPFVIDASGNTIKGYTSTFDTVYVSGAATTPGFEVLGTNLGTSSMGLYNFSTATSSAVYSINKSRSGAVGTHTIVQSGDTLGALLFTGSDGTGYIASAYIAAAVDGTPGTNDMPGRLVFSTTADGASSPTERVRIASDCLFSLQNSSGLSIARTAVTSPASTDGNVFSGTYTPSQVSTNTNIATGPTFSAAQYMRVGHTVTVSGQIVFTATASATDTTVKISLPIASNFSATRQLAGTGAALNSGIFGTNTMVLLADTTNDCVEMRCRPTTTSSTTYQFTFTYQVL